MCMRKGLPVTFVFGDGDVTLFAEPILINSLLINRYLLYLIFIVYYFPIYRIFYIKYIKRTTFHKNIRNKDEKIKICMIMISILYIIISKNPLF